MSTTTIRRCDNPTCHVEIPPTAKVWELDASLVLRNGGEQRATAMKELCGQACIMATVSALMRTVLEAEPVHSIVSPAA